MTTMQQVFPKKPHDVFFVSLLQHQQDELRQKLVKSRQSFEKSSPQCGVGFLTTVWPKTLGQRQKNNSDSNAERRTSG